MSRHDLPPGIPYVSELILAIILSVMVLIGWHYF
jgi:hypothetical protein